MTLGILILIAVTIERSAELPWSLANERRLKAVGGHEVAAGHYPAIVAVHVAWLAALWWWAPGQPVNMVLLAAYGAVQVLRGWTLVTLGRRWTTRIFVVPGETLVARGPYRFFDHPNYVVVVAEISLLPLVFGLWPLAVVFTLLNAAVLWVRIRAENRALGRS
ncbi:MAG: isoprenylcysteine carboxylmethyltransferase family protein [Sphingomicrobium sp.]